MRDKFYPLVAISLGPPHNRPTKRPVTRRNPLLVVVLILFPRRVAIPLAGLSQAGVGTMGDKETLRS